MVTQQRLHSPMKAYGDGLAEEDDSGIFRKRLPIRLGKVAISPVISQTIIRGKAGVAAPKFRCYS
jgi:hypothetical protein